MNNIQIGFEFVWIFEGILTALAQSMTQALNILNNSQHLTAHCRDGKQFSSSFTK